MSRRNTSIDFYGKIQMTKRKRRQGTLTERIEDDEVATFEQFNYIEVFDDDPADLDELLAAIDEPKPSVVDEETASWAAEWILNVMRARCNTRKALEASDE